MKSYKNHIKSYTSDIKSDENHIKSLRKYPPCTESYEFIWFLGPGPRNHMNSTGKTQIWEKWDIGVIREYLEIRGHLEI